MNARAIDCTALNGMTYEQVQELGYEMVRLLPDGRWVGISRQLTTWGLVVDIGPISYEHRYCYQDMMVAARALLEWDGQDHPPGNWVKLKGRRNGEPVDDLNPEWSKSED